MDKYELHRLFGPQHKARGLKTISQGMLDVDLIKILEDSKQKTLSQVLKVLEIGCGVGVALQDIISHAESRNIQIRGYGIDLFPEIAEENKALPVVADACALPFNNNTFDLIYSFGTLQYVDDPLMALSESYRVLKPGGTAVMHTAHTCFSNITFEEILKHTPRNQPFVNIIKTPELGRRILQITKTLNSPKKLSFKHKVSAQKTVGQVNPDLDLSEVEKAYRHSYYSKI